MGISCIGEKHPILEKPKAAHQIPQQPKKKVPFRGRTAVYLELETDLTESVKELHARWLPVTAECNRVEVLEIERDPGLTRLEFKGSPSRVHRFIKRKGFVLRWRTSIFPQMLYQ